MERKKLNVVCVNTARKFWGMENCSVGYDSVLRCSVWEYRDGYRNQIFLISACTQNHHVVEYLDCDFVGVRMVTFLFGIGVEWVERSSIFCFEC